MGWGYGIVNGREVGYSVQAKCDHEGCKSRIDRGMSYMCGNDHYGDGDGCGGFFCRDHLTAGGQLCPECADNALKEEEGVMATDCT